MRRISVFMGLAADDPEGQARIAAFLRGLQEGWSVGRNVRIDTRSVGQGLRPILEPQQARVAT